MVIFSGVITLADELGEEYYNVSVEYSDNRGNSEQLEVMIQNGNVFANAEMLTKRLGYQMRISDTYVAVFNKDNDELPVGVTQFFFDETKVSHMLFSKMINTYEAPFSSRKNEKGFWIPMEYSLIILNSGMLIVNDTVIIDMPEKDIIDHFYEVSKNSNFYNFEWNKDFGYSDLDWMLMSIISHDINVFNGILEIDSSSWASMFQSFALDSSAYDEKFALDIAMLLCVESDGELKATIEKIEMYKDIFSSEGQLGKLLAGYSEDMDIQIGKLYATSEKILQQVNAGNSPVTSYNKSYQALEDAFDKQTWFNETGGTVLKVQKDMSNIISFLDLGLKISEIVGYKEEFSNQEEFSINALQYYLTSSNKTDGRSNVSNVMKNAMHGYLDSVSSDVVKYSLIRFLSENIDKWLVEGIHLKEALGMQANIELIAWSIASKTVPFISNGLDAADKFELSLYSQVLQYDAYLNYQSLRYLVFDDEESITPDNLYNISLNCFTYLKLCYIARDAALGSLAGKKASIRSQIQPLIDEQNRINHEIAKIMIALKKANNTNNGNVYGFLPLDNDNYIHKYDDNMLIEVCKSNAGIPDVMDYANNWFEMANTLDMVKVTSEYDFIKIYELGDFKIEISFEEVMTLTNDGYQDICVNGVILGDKKLDVQEMLEGDMWMRVYPGDDNELYLTKRNDEYCYLWLYFSPDETLTNWILYNWSDDEYVGDFSNGYDAIYTVSEEWKKSYIKFIMEHGMNYESFSNIYMESYKLIDVNNDNIPELYINFGSVAGGDMLCGFYNDTIFYTHIYNYGFSYYEGQNLFLDSGGRMDGYHDIIYSIEEGEFVVHHEGSYGAADNGHVQIDSDGFPIYDYYWNGDKLASEEEYKNLLNAAYDIENANDPFDGAWYDEGRYKGNGICDYKEIINAIINY